MKYYILIIYLIIFSLPAVAQTSSLTGILQVKNGDPVPNATIVIKKLNKHTLTDENGRFEFTAIPHGKYNIEVYSFDVETKEFTVEVKAGSTPVTLEAEPSTNNLKAAIISANSRKREIETKGFAVNVIDIPKIAVQSIQTNELLDRTAGVRIRQDGGLGSGVNYNINGLSGNAIKIFIDGIPASNYGSAFSLSSIPASLIERVEVYKGVVPGHLSEDALGGAINVILKERSKGSFTTSYSIGSFNTHQWNMAGGYRWSNGLTVDGSAFYNYSDNSYKVWGDDIMFKDYNGAITESNGKKVKRFHDAYKSLGGRFNVGFTNVKWADRFLIGAVYSENYKEIQNGITMRVVYGDRHRRRHSNVQTLAYDKKDFLIKGLTLKVDASHSFLKRQLIDTVGVMYDWAGPIRYPDGSYVEYTSGAESGSQKNAAKETEHTYMVRTGLSYQLNDNHTFYANHLFNDFQRNSSDEFQPLALQKLKNTKDLQKNVLSFTYENISFSGKLRSSLFYKHFFQKVTSYDPYLENKEYKVNTTIKDIDYNGYGITLSYTLLPDLYLLGSAEKALRLPTDEELFGSGASDMLSALGLNPEKSFNANLGFNYSYAISAHSFGLNASVFFRDTKGMIRQVISGSAQQYSQFENLEDVLTKGIDAEFSYNFADKISFRFNISKFDVLFNTKYNEKGEPYQYYRTQIRNEPSFKFHSGITYFHKDLFLRGSRASIYYNINYVKGFLRNWSNVGTANLKEIPTQYPMDVGLTYSFPKNRIALSFDMKNMFDKQVYDNFGLQKPGRGFYGKITYTIL